MTDMVADDRRTDVPPIHLGFRDAQPLDVDELAWAGDAAHCAALNAALADSWNGDVHLVVAEAPNQRLIAHGALDLRPPDPKIWMLAVHEAWQSLGVGAALLAELEARAFASGASRVWLTVECDNPRAKALYLRRGYVEDGSVVETWPLADGRYYTCVCDRLVKRLAE